MLSCLFVDKSTAVLLSNQWPSITWKSMIFIFRITYFLGVSELSHRGECYSEVEDNEIADTFPCFHHTIEHLLLCVA